MAQRWKMTKFEDDHPDIINLKKILINKGSTSEKNTNEMSFLRKLATDSSGFTNPFNCK